MDLNKAGGTAFPLQFNVVGPATDPITGKDVPAGHTNAHVFVGATLRDYFAGKALAGLLSTCEREPGGATSSLSAADIARSSYEFADAMLAERAK